MRRPSAEKRLERLLVVIPWIMANDGPEVSEVCSRFKIDEDDLANDLELLFLCGLYPFTPDALIEADIVDGRVWIRSADQFQRPPRFTMEEALALVAAASTVAELPGNENNAPLRSALAKVSSTLGLADEDAVSIELANTPSQNLEVVQAAAAAHQVIEADYYSYGRDTWALRRMEPYQVFNSEGQWYLQARAPEVDEIRNFRVDRMRHPRMLDETFSPPAQTPEPRVYQARDSDPEVTIELDTQASWILDQHPVEQVKALKNGKTRVTLRVSEKLWLERLLLRLGPYAKVTSGDAGVQETARQILKRYE